MADDNAKWKEHSNQDYQKILSQAVHFTGKAVNSNATAGIRLGENEYLPDLPYVALSTVLKADNFLFDEGKNASNLAILKQGLCVQAKNPWLACKKFILPLRESVKKVISKIRKEKNSEKIRLHQLELLQVLQEIRKTKESIKHLGTCFKNFPNGRYELPENENVNLRLRQIILQTENGEDIAVTPLPSGILNYLISEKILQMRHGGSDQEKNHFKKSHFHIGGQTTLSRNNIGSYAEYLREILYFQPPSENQELKKAYRYFHRGIKLDIPQALLKELYFWRKRLLKKHGVMPSEAKYKQEEKAIIQKMAQVILKRADEAIFLLQKYQEKVAKKASSLEPLQLGLINPSLRDSVWKEAFSRRIYLNIIDSRIQTKAGTMYFAIDESAGLRWQDYILEVFGA